MITVTQGFGTSQIPLLGFGDNFTHADVAVVIAVTPSRYTLETFGAMTPTTEGLPSGAFSTEGKPTGSFTIEGAGE